MFINHEFYMQRCLQLAQLGGGWVAPNPMVGAVLVFQEQIIGEGYHSLYGQAHAEVNCINSVKEEDREKIKDSTLYVSLEPCVHFGKTPPCTNLILSNQIKKVVIGCMDPFDAVKGKGAIKLMQSGVEVIGPILEEECKALNKRFFHFHLKKRPFILLKWAQSANGMIGQKGKEVAISNDYTKRLVHALRSTEAAILVGTQTAMVDNPQLNNRYSKGPNPLRMVIDRNLKLSRLLNLLSDDRPTIVFNTLKHETDGKVKYVKLQEQGSFIDPILAYAFEHQLQSILVEGGSKLLQSFINQGIWDEAVVIHSAKTLGVERDICIEAPQLSNSFLTRKEKVGTDFIHYYKHNLT